MRIKPLVALLFWIWKFDDVRRTHCVETLVNQNCSCLMNRLMRFFCIIHECIRPLLLYFEWINFSSFVSRFKLFSSPIKWQEMWAHATIIRFISTNGFAVQVLHYLTASPLSSRPSYPAVAFYCIQVAICSARRSQDFKMTKSMMLSVVALAFLSLGSSKHMQFKDCGKLPTLLHPMQGHYDHVYRVCAPDVIKSKEPLKVLSSSGIRGIKFIPVYNFPAQ